MLYFLLSLHFFLFFVSLAFFDIYHNCCYDSGDSKKNISNTDKEDSDNMLITLIMIMMAMIC